jgi:hypothetical protein
MSTVSSDTHLILLLPLLFSLAGQLGMPKVLCIAARVALLLSGENDAALVDWIIGTAVAGIPIRERIQQCRAALSFPAAPRLAYPQSVNARRL